MKNLKSKISIFYINRWSKKKYTCSQNHTTFWIQSRNQSETRNEIFENYHEYETQLKNTRESEQDENTEVDKDIAKS